MALTTCLVRCALNDQNGQPLEGAVITATLNRFEVHQGHVVPRTTTATTAADGTATLALWPNALGAAASAYNISIQPSGGVIHRTTAVVPNLAEADLHLISELPPHPGLTNGQLLLDTAADAVAASQAALGYRDETAAYFAAIETQVTIPFVQMATSLINTQTVVATHHAFT